MAAAVFVRGVEAAIWRQASQPPLPRRRPPDGRVCFGAGPAGSRQVPQGRPGRSCQGLGQGRPR
eukprot:1415821-Lingulodinium_polyedra.AAC.1